MGERASEGLDISGYCVVAVMEVAGVDSEGGVVWTEGEREC